MKMREKDKEQRNINLISKFLRKLCRSVAKSVFPNNLRIFLLRKAGVKISDDVFITEGLTLVCSFGYEGNLIIEDRVSLAPNVIIIITSHPNLSKLKILKDVYPFINVKGKIHIKHDAWIGSGCIILPNVTIGEYSIVGAGSVVTKDVEPFTVSVGVPAKVIKKLSKEDIRKLKEIGGGS
ncbi:acyltransferase [Candidatus Parcubacteria bacterium]|nr:acyltransferase [Candidatus Parcubacteria bacterium]